MQKLSQTEELARTLAAHARRKTLTPDQISRAAGRGRTADVPGWMNCTKRWRPGVCTLPRTRKRSFRRWTKRSLVSWNTNSPPRAWRWMTQCTPI